MIDDSDMFSIAVDRTDARRIFASACSGIYRSSSRGDLWTKMQGIPGTNRRTHLILQDPVDERIIYAGTTQGLWKSSDGGSTWRKANPYPYLINSIAIDPTDHNQLYLATDRSAILKSHDGGLTFQPLNEGFINRNISGFVSEETLYLSSLYAGDFGGIFSSGDAGRSWKLKANQAALRGKNVISLAVSPVNSKLLSAGTYEGLLKSEDGGLSWYPVTGTLPRPLRGLRAARPLRRILECAFPRRRFLMAILNRSSQYCLRRDRSRAFRECGQWRHLEEDPGSLRSRRHRSSDVAFF